MNWLMLLKGAFFIHVVRQKPAIRLALAIRTTNHALAADLLSIHNRTANRVTLSVIRAWRQLLLRGRGCIRLGIHLCIVLLQWSLCRLWRIIIHRLPNSTKGTDSISVPLSCWSVFRISLPICRNFKITILSSLPRDPSYCGAASIWIPLLTVTARCRIISVGAFEVITLNSRQTGSWLRCSDIEITGPCSIDALPAGWSASSIRKPQSATTASPLSVQTRTLLELTHCPRQTAAWSLCIDD